MLAVKLSAAVVLLLVVFAVSAAGVFYYLSRVYLTNPRPNVAAEPVVVRINYTVVEDPRLKATAWSMVKWLNWTGVDIAVLKITVELENRGSKIVYYHFGGPCYPMDNVSFQPFTSHDGHKSNIVFNVTHGKVFDYPKTCLLSLIAKPLLPGELHVYEYYYVVTKPFKGTATVTEEVCLQHSSDCWNIKSQVEIDIP
mgnify:CR=1 FL=1